MQTRLFNSRRNRTEYWIDHELPATIISQDHLEVERTGNTTNWRLYSPVVDVVGSDQTKRIRESK